jgi:hypothetical protein
MHYRPRMNDQIAPSHLMRPSSSDQELAAYQELEKQLRSCPIGPGELLSNLGLFLTRASLARILFMHELYLKVLDVPGNVVEFGCQYGQNLALFTTFRTIYEPQNISRRIVGFDTFAGYTAASPKDGALAASAVSRRLAATGDGYEPILERILSCHAELGPRSHIRKHELVKGDAAQTLPLYLERNPEALIALAYFDIGVFEPTRRCLELIRDRMPKGAIIGFDHLAMNHLPGDSMAVNEVIGFRNCRFVRDPRVPYQCYVVIE